MCGIRNKKIILKCLQSAVLNTDDKFRTNFKVSIVITNTLSCRCE